MEQLRQRTGNVPQWPWLLRTVLMSEFQRQRELGFSYASDVFKRRDDEDPEDARSPEKKWVRTLFANCMKQSQGVLTVDGEEYLLLGWEWPNQGRESMRRADLVALNASGGLVVFECKLEGNSDDPVTALLEGLDYLACLTSTPNFAKITDGYSRWIVEPNRNLPARFRDVAPRISSQHEVIVLAPAGYFEKFTRSRRGDGWKQLADLAPTEGDPVRLRFARSEFDSVSACWAVNSEASS
jgi:3',5'-cyclic AMP phosphodiesterase CpdA